MEKKKKKRAPSITVYFSMAQYQEIRNLSMQSGYDSLSKLVRDRLFKEPLQILYRNQSMESFISAIVDAHETLKNIENVLKHQYRAYTKYPSGVDWTDWMAKQQDMLHTLSVKFGELDSLMTKCFDTCMHSLPEPVISQESFIITKERSSEVTPG